jgi:phage gp46-like protein
MPNDIRINWDSTLLEGDFAFDFAIQDFEADGGLETAVLISLFTDRRAREDDELPDLSNPDRRGWWGDLGSPEVEGDQIGSRLWLLCREKTQESVLVRAKKYTEEALSWMIEDGVAKSVIVETERQGTPGTDWLAISVQIYKPDGSTIALKYESQWDAQGLR